MSTQALEPPPTLGPGLARLIRLLDEAGGPLPLSELVRLLGSSTVSLLELEPFIRFDPDRYADNPIRRTAAFELSCMCWEPGQSSPAHDHRGSACCVRVMQGVLTNISYGQSPAPHAGRPAELCVGGLLAMQDTQTHRLANRRPPGDRLITLHAYSPPLIPADDRVVPIPGEDR